MGPHPLSVSHDSILLDLLEAFYHRLQSNQSPEVHYGPGGYPTGHWLGESLCCTTTELHVL